MATLGELQTWLSEAVAARHRLLTGAMYQKVAYNGGNEVTFASADIAKLESYIASLRSQIAALDGSPRSVSRPLYLGF